MLTRHITIALQLQTPKATTLVFRPRLTSTDDGLLLEREYRYTTAGDGTGSIDLPVKSVGSIRYDFEFPGDPRKTPGHFFLSAGSPIDLGALVDAGGLPSDSVLDYLKRVSRNFDGGAPDSVYLPSQVINGGTP